jgi:serine/threonine protein kinase
MCLIAFTKAAQVDSQTGLTVAIKKVLKSDKYSEGVNLGAIKELQAMQELNHNNIVKVCIMLSVNA